MQWSVGVIDKSLWVAVLLGAGFAVVYIPAKLNEIRNACVVPEPQDNRPAKQLQQDAEKALSLKTLEVLSEGCSHDIRTSAIKIVATRTVKSRARSLLLWDLASKNARRRGDAIRGMRFLLYNPATVDQSHQAHFLDRRTFEAIVTALRNLLPLHRAPNQGEHAQSAVPTSPIRPSVRPADEHSLLVILRDVLSSTLRPETGNELYITPIELAIDAGLVTKWLRFYPFPCALPENSRFNFKKLDICSLFERKAWINDDPLMGSIIKNVAANPIGNKQLRNAGLKASNITENFGADNTLRRPRSLTADRDVQMINGEGTAGAVTPPNIRHLLNSVRDGPRPSHPPGGYSLEEERLRRAHREAVVIAEPGSPLRRENIHQRHDFDLLFTRSSESTRARPWNSSLQGRRRYSASDTTPSNLSAQLASTLSAGLSARRSSAGEVRDVESALVDQLAVLDETAREEAIDGFLGILDENDLESLRQLSEHPWMREALARFRSPDSEAGPGPAMSQVSQAQGDEEEIAQEETQRSSQVDEAMLASSDFAAFLAQTANTGNPIAPWQRSSIVQAEAEGEARINERLREGAERNTSTE